MPDTIKTDNEFLASKVELRRYFMDKYHLAGAEPVRVFDCCQGDGVVWKTVRSFYPKRDFRYWGVDVKDKPGRLKIDSVRILQQPGWREDVVDIDTYGSPWKHWFAMLPHVKAPLTVFFTIGLIKIRGGRLDNLALKAMGVGSLEKLPPSMQGKLAEISVDHCLHAVRAHGLKFVELIEAFPQKNARYIGARIEPLATEITNK